MAREYRYLLLDVFKEAPLLGNQLAVFLDGEGLSDAEMQALARETNLSETTFCFPRDHPPGDGVRVRIFTTDEELPFAGHPTLGTAVRRRSDQAAAGRRRGAGAIRIGRSRWPRAAVRPAGAG